MFLFPISLDIFQSSLNLLLMLKLYLILLFAVVAESYHLNTVTVGTPQFDLYEQQQSKLQYVTILYPYELFCFSHLNDYCTYYFVRISRKRFEPGRLENNRINFTDYALPEVFMLKQSLEDEFFKLVKVSNSHIALSNHSLYSRTNQSTMVTLFKMDFNLAIYLKLREEMNPDTMVIPLRVRLHVPIPRNTRWTASCNGTICRITNAFTVNCPNEKQFHCTNLTYFIDKGYLNSNQSETISYVSKANGRRLILKEETIENRVWPNSEIKYRVPLVTYVGNSDSLMVRLTEGGRNSIIHHFEGRNITQVYPLRYGMYAVTVADCRFYVVDGFGSQPDFGLRHSRESRSRGSDFSVHKAAEPRSSCSVFFDDPIRVETQLSPDYIVLCKEGLTCVIVSSECEVVYRRRYEFATIDIKWSYRQRYISHNRIEVTVTAKSKVDSFSETITLPPKNQLQQRPIFYEYEGGNIWKVSYNESAQNVSAVSNRSQMITNSSLSNIEHPNVYLFKFPQFFPPQSYSQVSFITRVMKQRQLSKLLVYFEEHNLRSNRTSLERQLQSVLSNSSYSYKPESGQQCYITTVNFTVKFHKELYLQVNQPPQYGVLGYSYNLNHRPILVSEDNFNRSLFQRRDTVIILYIIPNGMHHTPQSFRPASMYCNLWDEFSEMTQDCIWIFCCKFFLILLFISTFMFFMLLLIFDLLSNFVCFKARWLLGWESPHFTYPLCWTDRKIKLILLLRHQFIRKDIHQTEEQSCNICLESIFKGQKVVQIYCRHEFHGNCFETWSANDKNAFCPVCRVQFSQSALQQFKASKPKYKADLGESEHDLGVSDVM